MDEFIYEYWLITAQEHLVKGSSPHIDPQNEEDWYKPQGLLNSQYPLEALIAGRKELGILRSSPHGYAIGRKKSVVISLEDIDPESGQTLKDPLIIGLWDEKKKKVVNEKEGPILTEQLYEILIKKGENLHLRPQSRDIESGGLGRTEHE